MTAVVIPVLDGAEVLARSVPAVLALDGVAEFVWVDDGSTDGTGRLLRDLLAGDPRASVVTFGQNRGRGAARNAGAAATRAETVVFLDADVTPPPSLARAFGRALGARGAVATVARLESVPTDPAEPYAVYRRHFPGGDPAPAGTPLDWRYFVTAACAVSRAAFDAVGGFDTTVAYGEDLVLGAALADRWPDGLVSSGQSVELRGLDTLDGVLARMAMFGRSLQAVAAHTPFVVEMAGLARLNRPGPARTVARSRTLAALVRRALPVLPERGVAVGVRYLLAHALAQSLADAQSRDS